MNRLAISPSDRETLQRWIETPTTPPRLVLRARVVLALAGGLSDREVARHLGVARQTVALWRRRVQSQGSVTTITTDAPGRGRKPSVPVAVRAAVLQSWLAGQQSGNTRSVRDLAREFGLSPATVHRTLKAGQAQTAVPPPASPGDGTPAGAGGD